MKDDLCEVGRCEIERECVRGDRVQREGGGDTNERIDLDINKTN